MRSGILFGGIKCSWLKGAVGGVSEVVELDWKEEVNFTLKVFLVVLVASYIGAGVH